MIYDTNCGVDESLYEVTGPVSAISSSTYTVTGLNAYSANYFGGGFAIYDTDMRLVTFHSGNDITLQLPFDSRVSVGTTISVYPGCTGNPSICLNRFNNISNYLGMPYVPNSNPVLWGVK